MTNYLPLVLSVVIVVVMLLFLKGKNSYPEIPILPPPSLPVAPLPAPPTPPASGSGAPPGGTLMSVEGYTPGYLDTGGYQSDYTSSNNGGIYQLVDSGASDVLNGYNLLA